MCGERRTEAKGKRREKSVKNAMLSPVHRGDICENLHAGRGERGITDQRGGGREGTYPVAIARVIRVGYSVTRRLFRRRRRYICPGVYFPLPYLVLFPRKSQGKVKGPLAASQPRDPPLSHETMRATLQPIAHAESFLAAFPAPTPTSAPLCPVLMRRHYSTSRERETCFLHDNYPSPSREGRSTDDAPPMKRAGRRAGFSKRLDA